jgi:drug/metabolite transporter (DMT)-like permease
MFPAFLAACLFSVSVIAASRSARLLGSHTANFWRVVVAVVCLGLWAHGAGCGFGGGAFLLFFLSGCVGFGFGDMALFQALPRLGPRLSSLMINCLAAPFAAVIEWVWLGTGLSLAQSVCGLLILGGVALALLPEHHQPIPKSIRGAGIWFGVIAGLGQGYGAVLSRKAYAAAAAAGEQVDGGTAAYQRILGGLVIVLFPVLWGMLRRACKPSDSDLTRHSPTAVATAAKWVLLNGLTGPTIGVAFYQWALKTTPAGIVLPITAMTPLLVIPFTYWFEGDRPSPRSLAGGAAAVLGVIGLTLVG